MNFAPTVNLLTPEMRDKVNQQFNPSVPSASIGNQLYFIPFFSGDNDVSVSTFLENLKLTSHLSAWTEPQTLCVARLRLSGSAADFVYANPHILESYGNFSNGLKHRFALKTSPLMLERMFTSCMQKPLESVTEYATRFRKLARQLRETSDSESLKKMIDHRLLSQFLFGLREEVGRFVLVRGPKTMIEAEEFAMAECEKLRKQKYRY